MTVSSSPGPSRGNPAEFVEDRMVVRESKRWTGGAPKNIVRIRRSALATAGRTGDACQRESDMRTPLLRSLAQLAHDHALAESRGVQPDDIRAERAFARERRAGDISRRDFLAGSAAAGAALALGATGEFARPALAAGARIAIVGGGIARPSAPPTLPHQGAPSTRLQAFPR